MQLSRRAEHRRAANLLLRDRRPRETSLASLGESANQRDDMTTDYSDANHE